LSNPASNAALAARYDAIPYAALPHALTHPDRLATVATFLGYAPPAPATCRVLEVGCNDGSNLIPMALSLPGATFVGCDLSANAIAAGEAAIEALGRWQCHAAASGPSPAWIRHWVGSITSSRTACTRGFPRPCAKRCSRWPASGLRRVA
jgi:SAM-dependent methyltransferase